MSASTNQLLGPPTEEDLELQPLARAPALEKLCKKSSKSSTSVLQLTKNAFVNAWRDICAIREYDSSRWSSAGRQFVLFFWIPFLFVAPISIPVLNSSRSQMPCNIFKAMNFEQSYKPWEIDKFFEITLSWGELSYTSAKIIDVAWDLVRVLYKIIELSVLT